MSSYLSSKHTLQYLINRKPNYTSPPPTPQQQHTTNNHHHTKNTHYHTPLTRNPTPPPPPPQAAKTNLFTKIITATFEFLTVVSSSLGSPPPSTVWPWRSRHYDRSTRRNLYSQRHSVTYQKTRKYINRCNSCFLWVPYETHKYATWKNAVFNVDSSGKL